MLRSPSSLRTILGAGLTSVSVGARLAPLRHPLFLAALFVLVANDHFFKRAGLLPGFVTGKASDFAGLVVAPVLAACLVGASSRRRRAAAFALVGGGFVVVKVSQAAADALCFVLGILGVPSRLLADPTDLVGLACLPLAWLLLDATADSRDGASAGVGSVTRWSERALVGVSAVACVATSQEVPPATFDTPAYIVNTRDVEVDVRVRTLEAPTDCKALDDHDLARVLGPDAFGLGVTYRIAPDQVLALSMVGADVDPDLPGSQQRPPPPPCSVYAISIGNGRETLLQIPEGASEVQVEATMNEEDDVWDQERFVVARIEVTSSGIEVKDLPHVAIERDVEPDVCGVTDVTPIDVDLPSGTPIVIDAITTRPEGCVEITHHDAKTSVRGIGFVCVPEGAFPFVVGETIFRSGDDLVPGTLSGDDYQVTFHVDVPAIHFPGNEQLVASPSASCAGNRLDCGGYEIDGVAELYPVGAAPDTHVPVAVVLPGASVPVGNATVFVGRVRTVLVRAEACDATLGPLGNALDAVVVERIAP